MIQRTKTTTITTTSYMSPFSHALWRSRWRQLYLYAHDYL